MEIPDCQKPKLTYHNNRFGSLSLSANHAIVTEADAIDLNNVTVTRLTLTTTADITDSGAVVVADTAIFNTPDGASIRLNDAGNNFNSVIFSGLLDAVALTDSDGITLGALNATSLLVTAGGDITQSGDFTIANHADFNALGVDVLLNSHINKFGTLSLQAINAMVTEIGSTDLREVAVAADLTLTVNAHGDIGNSGALVIGVKTIVDSGDNATIRLDHAGNDFARVIVGSSGDSVVLNDISGLVLQGVNGAADLLITAAGDIGDNGAVVVSGATILDSGGHCSGPNYHRMI